MAPKPSPYPFQCTIITLTGLSCVAMLVAETPPLVLLIMFCSIFIIILTGFAFIQYDTRFEQQFYTKYESIRDGFAQASEVFNQVWINNTPEYVNMNAQSEHTVQLIGR